MNTLGIDFGLSKIGLAIATAKIAEPLDVIHYKNKELMLDQIKMICFNEKIQRIVIGISEGKTAEETQKFVDEIKHRIYAQVFTYDETLSTQDAQAMAIEAGMKRSKRHEMEDAMAAAIMLQNYLDSND